MRKSLVSVFGAVVVAGMGVSVFAQTWKGEDDSFSGALDVPGNWTGGLPQPGGKAYIINIPSGVSALLTLDTVFSVSDIYAGPSLGEIEFSIGTDGRLKPANFYLEGFSDEQKTAPVKLTSGTLEASNIMRIGSSGLGGCELIVSDDGFLYVPVKSYIGNGGRTNNHLKVLNGGTVIMKDGCHLGDGAFTRDNHILVSGKGSSLYGNVNSASAFYIGNGGTNSHCGMTIEKGALLVISNGFNAQSDMLIGNSKGSVEISYRIVVHTYTQSISAAVQFGNFFQYIGTGTFEQSVPVLDTDFRLCNASFSTFDAAVVLSDNPCSH